MKQGSDEYKRLLRRFTILLMKPVLTPEEDAEYKRIDALLIEAEMQGKGIRELTSDYDQLRYIGDLGGAEF